MNSSWIKQTSTRLDSPMVSVLLALVLVMVAPTTMGTTTPASNKRIDYKMTFSDKMDALSNAFQYSETSGRRSPTRNRKVGGAKNSMHLLGLARDCVLDDRKDVKHFRAMAKRLKLWTLDEHDHIHVHEIP